MGDLPTILTLQSGYNTAVVIAGSVLLGIGGGAVGAFAFLRKRALVSDAISHATLPGIALGFLAALALGLEGKSLPVLLIGSAASAALGVAAVQWIRDHTRLPEDAAIGTVLSVFYGLGIVLMSHVQTLPSGGQAGLESFLLGNTAAMLRSEAILIGAVSAAVIAVAVLFFKEFGLVCFDPDYAAARGWRVGALDLLMMGLLLTVVVIGLKTVGLILIVALVVIPPAGARFWTDRLGPMVAISAVIGGTGAWLGAGLSALAPDLPTGALIVLTLFALFALGLVAAPRRGVVAWAWRQRTWRRRMRRRQGLLALAEARPPVPAARRLLAREGLLGRDGRPTAAGRRAADAAARDQALWDRFLADHPEEAFALADWATRPIERVLPADLVAELARRIEAGETAKGRAGRPQSAPATGTVRA